MTEMSKEDMVKEAVEEAKAKAAQEDDSDQEETAQTEENTEAAAEEAEDQKETPETENDGSGDAENGEPKEEKKKFFGKKNKKDKKDEKIEELTDRLTRQMAEFDNFRKRTEKEKSQMYEIGAKDIIEKILPIVDNLKEGCRPCRKKKRQLRLRREWKKIYKQLMTTLESIDVKPIEAVGKEFNPDFHNAVMHVEDEELGENIVAEEFQKGYTYRDSVVRHSMVKVAN